MKIIFEFEKCIIDAKSNALIGFVEIFGYLRVNVYLLLHTSNLLINLSKLTAY